MLDTHLYFRLNAPSLTFQYTGEPIAVGTENAETFWSSGDGKTFPFNHISANDPESIPLADFTPPSGYSVLKPAKLLLDSPLSSVIGGGVSITYSTSGGGTLTASSSVNWTTALGDASIVVGQDDDDDITDPPGTVYGSRIVVAGETNSAHNGIYTITSSTTLVRHAFFNSSAEMTTSKVVYVQNGYYTKTGWALKTAVASVGTSPVKFIHVSGAYIKNTITNVTYDEIKYFDGHIRKSKNPELEPPTEIGRCDIVLNMSKTIDGVLYRGYSSTDYFKGIPDNVPAPNPHIIADEAVEGILYHSSFYTNGVWIGGQNPIDPRKAIIIEKKPVSITLSNLNKRENGLSEPPTVTTNPPNIAYRLTYDGKIHAPILEGEYDVFAEIVDRNYKGSTLGKLTIAPKSASAAATDLKNKKDALGESTSASEFVTDKLLETLDLDQVQSVNKLKSLADCAKSLPDKLLEGLKQKAISAALQYASGLGIINLVKTVTDTLGQVQKISDKITEIKENPETLLDSVIKKSGLPGEIDKLKSKFPFADIDALLDKGNAICNSANFDILGNLLGPKIMADPTKTAQPVVKFTPPQITFDNERKGNYDNFMFQLKDVLTKDNTKIEYLAKNNPAGVNEYISMITAINEIAHSQHDSIAKATGTPTGVATSVNASVEAEIARHPEWSPETIAEFRTRATGVGIQMEKNTDTIQAYQQRSAPVTGGLISTGVTVYSGPDKDYTTYFDIKPSQRPPEVTAYWRSKGKNLEAQEAKLNARGIKTGTLNYSDAFNGAYGKLQSDFTCASTRFKGGSVLALKNPDGTPYNPTGKNPQGIYTVTDTGNAELTYKKVDIFTSTPEAYTNMDKVGVYLVTEGTKEGKQYKLAQSKFGASQSSGPVTANIV